MAASLGLALSGCGAKDKNSFLIRKASTSKVEKTAKTNSKRVQHLLLGQTMQLVLRLKPVARQLQKTLVRPRMRLLRRKPPVPAELVGTWVGSSPQADSIKMTVDANGDVTTVVSFKMTANRLRTATYTARAVKQPGKYLLLEC